MVKKDRKKVKINKKIIVKLGSVGDYSTSTKLKIVKTKADIAKILYDAYPSWIKYNIYINKDTYPVYSYTFNNDYVHKKNGSVVNGVTKEGLKSHSEFKKRINNLWDYIQKDVKSLK